jgi:protein tyrosine/serine phosphatase
MKTKVLFALTLAFSVPAFAMGSPTPPPVLDPTLGIERFYEIVPGLFRGGRLDDAQRSALKSRYKLRTILNIEDDKGAIKAEIAHARELGIEVISIPLNGNKNPPEASMDRVEAIMADRSKYPLYVHCKHGRDRTGMAFGIFRVNQQGWSQEAAYEEMIEKGFRPFFFKLEREFRERTDHLNR